MRLLFVVLFLTVSVYGQQPFMDSITGAELKRHLEIIASDAFEGRGTGEKGQKLAAAYLSEQFAAYGLEQAEVLDSYFQKFELHKVIPGGELEVNGTRLSFPGQFLYTGPNTIEEENIEFIPFSSNSVGKEHEYALLVQGKETYRELFGRIKDVQKAGFGGVGFLIEDWDNFNELYGHYFNEARLVFPGNVKTSFASLFIDKKSFELSGKVKKWMKKPSGQLKELLQGNVRLNDGVEVIETENVLGVIPGSHPVLKDEVVVLTAHYDHLGKEDGVIYNGADDDGSGTVALLEIAQSLALAKKAGQGPLRTILIMPVTAEEKGLLGSKYYSENPVFPMHNTIANLNIDMIGRSDDLNEDPAYIYVIGSDRLSDDLHKTNEAAAEELGKIRLDYRYNSEDDPNRFYYRSDHYNFVVHGVPSIFYFSGVHEDYHQPTDTVEKIDFEKLESVTRLIFLVTWKLANAEERPVVNKLK